MNTRKSMMKQQQQQQNTEKIDISINKLSTSASPNLNLITKIIIDTHLQREKELRIKENYLNHLKSIDISKFSYPNETKPPTDYTYAKTSSYLSSAIDNDNDNCEMPNLRRRSLKLTQHDTNFLSSSFIFTNNLLHKQLTKLRTFITNLNLFDKFKMFRQNQATTTRVNNDDHIFIKPLIPPLITTATTNQPPKQQQQKKRFVSNFIPLLLIILLILISLPFILLALNNLFSQILINNDIKIVESSYTLMNYSIKFWSNAYTTCKDYLKQFFISMYELKRDLFSFVYVPINKLFNKEKSQIHIDLNEKVLSSINSIRDSLFTEVINKFENYKHSHKLVDMDVLRDELDKKFNLTLNFISTKLIDQAMQIEQSKKNYENEIKQMKSILDDIEAKYAANLNQIQDQLKKHKQILEDQFVQNRNNNNNEKENVIQPLKVISENEYISFEKIEEFINKTLYLYNADKTGMTDFASESVGGSILFTRCTESYQDNSRWFTVFDVPITRVFVSPRVVIQGSIQPGNCWSFKGSKGDLFIKLAAKITPKSFSLEHIPKELSLTGNIDSAPQNFTVYGYSSKDDISDEKRILLGSYRYDSNSKYPLQFFDIQNECTDKPIGAVELKIESNAGNKDYTCLYKFRVHGKLFNNINDNNKKSLINDVK